MRYTVESVVHVPTILGEGPIWSPEQRRLYWLDIFRPALHAYDPLSGKNEVVQLEEPIYALGLRAGGGFVAAFDSGFALLSVDGTTEHLCNPIKNLPVNFNDGKVDRQGRFWSGTMARDWQSPIGALYRLDPDNTAHKKQDGLILSNGLGWSPDGTTMYHTDFKKNTIYAYDFSAEHGEIENRRPFISLEAEDGSPDGLTVDADGYIWVAHWDGWCVTCHDPSGREVLRIDYPVPRPTCPAFGGEGLRTLYVTSATMHLDDGQLAAAPLSGALFAVETESQGMAEPCFAH